MFINNGKRGAPLNNLYIRLSFTGSIPAKHYYDPDGMKPKDKKKFEELYQVQTGTFDFKKELLEYCLSDVKLLRKGCEEFTEEFKSKTEFNPFEKCTTIVAACNLYWRRSIEEGTDAARSPEQEENSCTLERIKTLRTGVSEGPCGLPELSKFQQYLSTLDPPYQLMVSIHLWHRGNVARQSNQEQTRRRRPWAKQ